MHRVNQGLPARRSPEHIIFCILRTGEVQVERLEGELGCGAAADVITPDDVFDVLEGDVRDADMILWVGISFQQSASTAYFRRVRGYLQASLTSTA